MAAPTAVDTYVSEFRTLERELGRRDAAWLGPLRRSAIERFAALGFPSAKDEGWKYTNVAPIAKTPFRPAPREEEPRVLAETLDPLTFGLLRCTQLVFVNGHHVPRLSWHRPLPKGVRATGLGEALRDDPGAAEPRLGKLALFSGDPFTALNTAFFRDGAFVDVPAGTLLEEPIHLLFLSTPDGGPTASYPRSLVLLGEGAQATVIETHASLRDGTYLTDGVTEVFAGPDSILRHYRLGREADRAFHVSRTEVLQSRGSRVSSNTVHLGGGLVRNDVNVRFAGEGGELSLDGLYMLRGAQHFDVHTKIDHAAPACTSRELFKGILDGTSKGIFNGQVYVREGAQKTVARQTNRNLLLSNDAWVDSTPGLTILADDVKCAHGSSIGQLDEGALFYMRSRGIDEPTARNILTYAFASEIINLVHLAPMRVKVNELVLSRLPYGRGIKEIL